MQAPTLPKMPMKAKRDETDALGDVFGTEIEDFLSGSLDEAALQYGVSLRLDEPIEDNYETESEIPGLPDYPLYDRILADWEARAGSFDKGSVYVLGARYLWPRQDLRDIFEESAEEWERETLVVSSRSQAISHQSYRRVIGLGLQAVPLLLERLQTTRRSWFAALVAITGENPAEGATAVDEAIARWVEWGQTRSYLTIE